MEKTSQTSRRNFLGTVALFSAGAAMGGMNVDHPAGTDLKKDWNLFCKKFGGKKILQDVVAENNFGLKPSAGHFYKTGEHIVFVKESIYAIPTWIYWGQNNLSPSDLVVTFYTSDNSKLGRMNRFEMEALTIHSNTLAFKGQAERLSEILKKKVLVKALIRERNELHLSMQVGSKQVSLCKKLIFNS